MARILLKMAMMVAIIASPLAPLLLFEPHAAAQTTEKKSQDVKSEGSASEQAVAVETELSTQGIFARAWRGGFVIFSVLIVLVILSILSWAISFAKLIYLRQLVRVSDSFVKNFWDSRSLNDLNGRLSEFPYSPVKEVFRVGYAELVKANQLRDQAATNHNAVHAAVENMNRSLAKGKMFERRRLEQYLPVLAITASSAPFIGLFGTVWGIMGSFEGIARTGSASLAAVAPGISEALIATAFGLGAAIPALIGYNIAAGKIRGLMVLIDGFSADFLNIVERYLVTDRTSKSTGSSAGGSDKV
jgi:biopolymer transport protein TolQ